MVAIKKFIESHPGEEIPKFGDNIKADNIVMGNVIYGEFN